MKVLIDTNIIISREDNRVVSENTLKLFQLLSSHNIQIIVHPASIDDIQQDRNLDRREINLSKIKAYLKLASPPNPNDDLEFCNLVGQAKNQNDFIDNNLLYAVYKNALNFLVTEDKGIKKQVALTR